MLIESTVTRLSKALLAAASSLVVLGGPAPFSGLPVVAAEWKVGECEADVDDGGEPIQVCDDGTHMGVFWNDGSFVNGVCSEKDGSYDIEYKGLSRSDALSWVKDICGS